MPEYYYYLKTGGLILGYVAPVFAACCLPLDGPWILLRCLAAFSLVLLGIVSLWIGFTVEVLLENPGDASWMYVALGAWILTVPICCGIFLVSAIIRVVWTWVRSPANTSPEDRVPDDQVTQVTSVPESSNGDPYPESATWD